MKKNIKLYSAMALGAGTLVPLACKKEKNDPNIIDKSISKTMTIGASPAVNIDSIDIDENGTFDMAFVLFSNNHDSIIYSYLAGINENALFRVDVSPWVTALAEGSQVDTSMMSDKFNELGILHGKILASGTNQGIGGQGDKFLGFIFRDAISAPAAIHNGWLKVNLSTDLKTFTIKELAYQKNAGVPISVGAR